MAEEHITATAVRESDGEYVTTCSCGARWTHSKDSTPEHRESIYQSHLKYFNRPKMETL